MDVLIVEDDVLQREALTAELEQAGLEVESVGAAEPALRLLECRGPPPVVLADLALGPGAGGHALGEAVLRAWPDVSVVYITGHPEALCGRAIGVRECILPKPVGPELVAGLVRQLIGEAPLG
jgi:DNA-binding NtrC family response regulator